MSESWTILHGGALGDLVLTLQLALRLPGVSKTGALHVVSRIDPGDLSVCRPQITRTSSEIASVHWLFGDHDDPPPARLVELLRGQRVLNALGGPHTIVHQRLAEFGGPGARGLGVYSFDSQPRAGVQRHITEQWRSQLDEQGLLVPKCVHQRPQERAVGVPERLRKKGTFLISPPRESNAVIGLGKPPEVDERSLSQRKLGMSPFSILIHPGSGGRPKCRPLASYDALARLLRSEGHCDIHFVIGHVELETWPRDDLRQLDELAREFPVLRSPTPDDLVAILAGAGVYIGNDSGPTHLAALLGTPTVALFGPTPAAVWRPLGPRVQVITGDPSAGPDWGIAPASVARAVLDMAPWEVCDGGRTRVAAPPVRP